MVHVGNCHIQAPTVLDTCRVWYLSNLIRLLALPALHPPRLVPIPSGVRVSFQFPVSRPDLTLSRLHPPLLTTVS